MTILSEENITEITEDAIERENRTKTEPEEKHWLKSTVIIISFSTSCKSQNPA